MAIYQKQIPLFFQPAYKSYVWGGQKIFQRFNRKKVLDVCAESWEVSDRDEGLSAISPFYGNASTFKEVLNQNPEIFGVGKKRAFPLLIKLIDAAQSLSVQVHPCEKSAQILKGEVKNELWHILDAEKNSCIYLGLNKKFSKEDVQKAVESKSLHHCLNSFYVKKGQTYFIPAGLIHSIGEGCLIYEVQQSSNTTYRLYDWQRELSAQGKRELHIKEGLVAMNEDQSHGGALKGQEIFSSSAVKVTQKNVNPHFSFNVIELYQSYCFQKPKSCAIYFLSRGKMHLSWEGGEFFLESGNSFVIPKYSVEVTARALLGPCEVLETIPN